MPSFVTATIDEILSERAGFQRVSVRTDAGNAERAYVLTKVIGPVAVGDRVIMNTTAVELNLGTGGWHVVHWNLSRDSWHEAGGGHVMKMRYTSVQLDVGVAEEADGYESPKSLDGMPVVACLLHSHVPAVVAAAKHVAPHARIAFVMTDQAALPLAFSDLTHGLREAGLIDATITAGQAFGGDYEAVNVTSALGLAKSLAHADITLVSEGPGVVGTDSPVAFSGLEMASILDQARRYDATPILALRWSDADPRPRHQGMSHHSFNVLDRAILPVHVGVPAEVGGVESQRHVFSGVEVPDIAALFAEHDLQVTSMGRSPQDDPGFFRFAAAAGVLAARFISNNG